MANKIFSERCSDQRKTRNIQQNKLIEKLQLNLEKDLLRLFQNSLYCDIKFTVKTSYISTHSCILKTRACKFYKFLYTEFEVLIQNGISVFNFYNASFTCLQAFIQNVYTNIHSSKAEDSIIKHLQETKSLSAEKNTNSFYLLPTNPISPESDLFFTPKCSPSELQKSFAAELKSKENVVSYYKIVSDDDIPIDNKLEKNRVNKNSEKREEKLLEQELAEQDELLFSFKTKFIKNKKKENFFLNQSNSSQSTKKIKPKVRNKNFESTITFQETNDGTRNKLQLWKANLADELKNLGHKQSAFKNITATSIYQTVQEKRRENRSSGDSRESENLLCTSDMDLSTTGLDSGLDNSSVFPPETSLRENTVSETSGVDLTESIANDELPKDETISANQSDLAESSLSSGLETWKAGEESKPKEDRSNDPVWSLDSSTVIELNDPGAKNNLNEEELNRLEEMEKSIRDCEIFLDAERKESDFEKSSHYSHSGFRDCKVNGDSNDGNHDAAGEEESPKENDSSSGCEIQQESNAFFGNSDSDSDARPKNEDIQETKTPPCTPKKAKLENAEENHHREGVRFPEIKSNKWEINHSSGVSNYFIDASNLMDEDEIVSPPTSLINFKSVQIDGEEDGVNLKREEPERCKKIVSNFFYPYSDSEKDLNVFQMHQKERQQGNIIFKNSIPHFSKHEIVENEILRGGPDEAADDSEQVVPSGDLSINSFEFKPEETTTFRWASADDEKFSLEAFDSPEIPKFSEDGQRESSEQKSRFSNAPEAASPPSKIGSKENLAEDSHVPSRGGNVDSRGGNESPSIPSGGAEFSEEKKEQNLGRGQAEAWVVTFENNKKPKSKIGNNLEPILKAENGNESKGERKSLPSHQSNHQFMRNESPSESFLDFDDAKSTKSKIELNPPQQKGFAIEKSSSFGYFLDFGKQSDHETHQIKSEKIESQPEKKNIFSMFIGIDDNNPKSGIVKKSKQVLEKERILEKSCEGTPDEASSLTSSDTAECQEEMKRSFYMFIESDSPSVRRKRIPKKAEKSSAESRPSGNVDKKISARSHAPEQHVREREESRAEVKIDSHCSSGDGLMPHLEEDAKSMTSSGGKFRESDVATSHNEPPKFIAWSESNFPKTGNGSSESWLKTRDVLVNYTGKNHNRIKEPVKKDSTLVMEETRGKFAEEISTGGYGKSMKPNLERDTGNVSSRKTGEGFLKLSDMDNRSDAGHLKQERMSQSISETAGRKGLVNGETSSLSRSTGSEMEKPGVLDLRVNRSLSRIFPNVSTSSLASLSKRDGDRGDRNDTQGSEHSEVSNSLQSSIEPSPLEISTSETDVSTHGGASTRLGEDLLKMFLEEIGPDVTLEVSGRRIKAHKCILSSRCQYFAAMLSGGWVESAGNVISLQGFSYNAVHFALRYIYSGESRIPESLNIVELATLADMLCLDGLQEIISYDLKVKYCHSFHAPCSICSVGVIDCLPIAAAYGLDDLYRKCLRWITKYFVKLWPTKSFGSLPKELLEKCYQHYVVHMTVDNVLDTVVNIDKVGGSLTNVRWADNVSRLVKKLHGAAVRYIAEHFSSILTSDNFLALGKEDGWNVGRLEESLIETINYLPPEQACWSHARLHRILSVANGHDPPPEMDWNEGFLKLLQLIAELVENSLIKQAPRAAKSKAWRQLEPELRSRIQEAACLILPDEEPSPSHRKPYQVKKSLSQPKIPQPAAKSRSLEIRQIKMAMSQQASNRNSSSGRPLSLQVDQRPKKDSRFVPLRPSASTSSVRKSQPMEIRKSQSRSQILGSTISEPKKTINPRYSEVKSRYLEPRSPQKSAPEKRGINPTQRRNSQSNSSRSSSALRPQDSRNSAQSRRLSIGSNRQSRNSVLRSDSATVADDDGKQEKCFGSTRSATPSVKMEIRLRAEENMSTDSLYTDSLKSDREETPIRRRTGQNRPVKESGRESPIGTVKLRSGSVPSTSSKPTMKSNHVENGGSWRRTTSSAKTKSPRNSAIPDRHAKSSGSIPAKGPNSFRRNASSSSSLSSPRPAGNRRNLNASGKIDSNLLNGNPFAGEKSTEKLDSENNRRTAGEDGQSPRAVSRSGTFLKEEPTVLKRPQSERGTAIGRLQ